jgi:chromosome segregation ATPase
LITRQTQIHPEVRGLLKRQLIQQAIKLHDRQKSETQTLDQRVTALTADNQNKDDLIKNFIGRFSASKTEKEKQDAQIRDLEEQLEASRRELEALRQQQGEQSDLVQDILTSTQQKQSDESRNLEERFAALGDLPQQPEASAREKALRDQIDKLEKQVADLTQDKEKEIRRLQEELNTLTRESQGHLDLIRNLQQEVTASTQEMEQSDRIDELEGEVADWVQQNETKRNLIDKLQDSLAALKLEKQELARDLEASRREQAKLARDLEASKRENREQIYNLQHQLAASTLEQEKLARDHEEQLADSTLEKEEQIRGLKEQLADSTQENRERSDLNRHLEQQVTDLRENRKLSDEIRDLEPQFTDSTQTNRDQSDLITEQDKMTEEYSQQVTALTRDNRERSDLITEQNDIIEKLSQRVTDLMVEEERLSVLEQHVPLLEQHIPILTSILQQLRSRPGGDTGTSEEIPQNRESTKKRIKKGKMSIKLKQVERAFHNSDSSLQR